MFSTFTLEANAREQATPVDFPVPKGSPCCRSSSLWGPTLPDRRKQEVLHRCLPCGLNAILSLPDDCASPQPLPFHSFPLHWAPQTQAASHSRMSNAARTSLSRRLSDTHPCAQICPAASKCSTRRHQELVLRAQPRLHAPGLPGGAAASAHCGVSRRHRPNQSSAFSSLLFARRHLRRRLTLRSTPSCSLDFRREAELRRPLGLPGAGPERVPAIARASPNLDPELGNRTRAVRRLSAASAPTSPRALCLPGPADPDPDPDPTPPGPGARREDEGGGALRPQARPAPPPAARLTLTAAAAQSSGGPSCRRLHLLPGRGVSVPARGERQSLLTG